MKQMVVSLPDGRQTGVPRTNTARAASTYDDFIAGWQRFLDHLQDLDVMEAPSLQRIIDGTALANGLGVRPGKWMRQALDVCVAWQLRHPGVADPAGAVEEVRRRREELNIPAR